MKKNELIKIIADLQSDIRWMKETFQSRLNHLEENNLWITRLVVGTIITAMIGTIFLLNK